MTVLVAGSSSVFRSAFAAFGFIASAGSIDRDLPAAELARQREPLAERAHLIDGELGARLAVVANLERDAHEIGMAARRNEQATPAFAARAAVGVALRHSAAAANASASARLP